MKLHLVWCFAIQITVYCTVHGVKYTTTTNTEYGPVRGIVMTLNSGKDVNKYIGIPYARAKRFGHPKSLQRWGKTFIAVSPKVCPQHTNPVATDEDCLTLNIYSSSENNRTSLLVVMVYLHSGGFQFGNGASEDGTVLASEQNILVVSINFRLGVLGFLCTGSKELKGNYGMLDQIAALRWVQRNIRRFGGDPDKVTIVGQSSGGTSAALLMLSPLAHGLFNNVLAMSGAASTFAVRTKNEAIRNARKFANIIGCSDFDKLYECLGNKTTAEIINAQLKVPVASIAGAPFAPCVDDYFLLDIPSKLLKEGRFNQTNVMFGVTNDDGSVGFLKLSGMPADQRLSREAFLRTLFNTMWIRGQNQRILDALEQEYTDWANYKNPNTTRRMLLDLFTDNRFIVPAVLSVRDLAKMNLKTFFYQFEYRPPTGEFLMTGKPVSSWMRAFHAADLLYLFGKEMQASEQLNDTRNETYGNESREFGKKFRTLVANFVKTGDPNSRSSPTWPPFTLEDQKYLRMKPEMSVGTNLRADQIHFWSEFLPTLVSNETLSPTTVSLQPTTAPATGEPPKRNKVVIALAITTAIFFVLSLTLFGLLIYICVKGLRDAHVTKGGYSGELIERT